MSDENGGEFDTMEAEGLGLGPNPDWSPQFVQPGVITLQDVARHTPGLGVNPYTQVGSSYAQAEAEAKLQEMKEEGKIFTNTPTGPSWWEYVRSVGIPLAIGYGVAYAFRKNIKKQIRKVS